MDLHLGGGTVSWPLRKAVGMFVGRERGAEEDAGLGGGLGERRDGLPLSPQWPSKPSSDKVDQQPPWLLTRPRERGKG